MLKSNLFSKKNSAIHLSTSKGGWIGLTIALLKNIFFIGDIASIGIIALLEETKSPVDRITLVVDSV
ncbi:hypothetical protein QJS10_CPB22g00055 [Acorus calamus]|uniref:Uncharacterized protein n=1 Tax=Acorus calamus TaxID=4465 RepID=A0AAV9BZI2_ACOCL|nr:hypothetical protein QJS10_CPB22g00055 [Acorus calamus]